MKHLLLFLLSFQAAANITCYTYGNVTSCTDGTSAYQYGNMTQILPPNGKPQITMYRYGNQTQIITPFDFAPKPLNDLGQDIPLGLPSPNLPSLR